MQGSRGPGYKRGMSMSFEKNDPNPRLPASLLICLMVRRLPALLISGRSLAAQGKWLVFLLTITVELVVDGVFKQISWLLPWIGSGDMG